MKIFEGDTADQVWQKALNQLKSKNAALQASRNGPTYELLHSMFVIRDPQQRWVLSRRPGLNPAFAIAEVIWIVSGRNDARFLNYWNNTLPKYAGDGAIYHGAYGFRIRNHFGIDQLERAYHSLKNNPESRQVILQIWDPQIDLPDAKGAPVNSDIPCNVMAILKVRDGKLEWMQINRSNDIYLGVPYNFIQFTSLQEILAGWLGLKIGSYCHLSDSLHLYTEAVKAMSCVETEVGTNNSDSLMVERDESTRIFYYLQQSIEEMVQDSLPETRLTELLTQINLPPGYANLLRVLIFETARRREWNELSNQALQQCTNPALRQAMVNWRYRVAN